MLETPRLHKGRQNPIPEASEGHFSRIQRKIDSVIKNVMLEMPRLHKGRRNPNPEAPEWRPSWIQLKK